jgi:hypothetical protein
MDAEIQRPRMAAIIKLKRLIKRLCHLIVTIHGLDTGIHAGMTA